MLVYIHIPFCDSKCNYCSFNSYVDKFHLKRAYIDALHRQLHHELQCNNIKKNSIKTLFLGGGTPSTITPHLYEKIFSTLQPYLQDGAEITTEANPNSATKEWLAGMFALGVNRISFGVQSFHEQKLKLLNRSHSPQQAKMAIENSAEIGFTNISLDLIYGVLGDTKRLLQHDIEQAFALPINHLSAYALTIEEGTPFEKTPSVAAEKLSETRWLFEQIISRGLPQYEISNFGSYQSVHNLGYWQYEDYIGLGSGAVGKINNIRYYPQRDIQHYIIDPLSYEEESLTEEDICFEKIFLGLRSIVGVKEELLTPQQRQRAKILLDERKLSFRDGSFYNEDFLLADEITLFLNQ